MAGHLGEELQGFRVAPLRVIDNDKERTVTRLQPGNFEKTGGQATFALDQVVVYPVGVGDTDVEQGLESWGVIENGIGKLLQNGREPAFDVLRRVVVREAEPGARNGAGDGVGRMSRRQLTFGEPDRAVIDQRPRSGRRE